MYLKVIDIDVSRREGERSVESIQLTPFFGPTSRSYPGGCRFYAADDENKRNYMLALRLNMADQRELKDFSSEVLKEYKIICQVMIAFCQKKIESRTTKFSMQTVALLRLKLRLTRILQKFDQQGQKALHPYYYSESNECPVNPELLQKSEAIVERRLYRLLSQYIKEGVLMEEDVIQQVISHVAQKNPHLIADSKPKPLSRVV